MASTPQHAAKAPLLDASAVNAVVGARSARRWRTLMVWFVALAALATAAVYGRQALQGPPPQPMYQTQAISLGDIDETVEATGTLEARRVVSVGGEISGRVATVLVEVNDHVEQGQVLATLDPTSLDNALTEAKGSLTSARVEVTRATAALEAAEITKERVEALHAKGMLPKEDLDTATNTYRLAKADLQRAKSERSLASIRVEQAGTNRDKATIVAPIDGVVLTRSVEPGNAIAASLEAPELFTIAEDLTSMRLDLGVDEADVGRVSNGQTASFTVDAWPGRTFEATVERVDLAPAQTDSAVVTYTTVLAVRNDDGLLRPGMTASATILAERHAGVLRVAAAALRFDPSQVAPTSEASGSRSPFGGMPGPPPGATKKKQANPVAPTAGSDGTVWILRGQELVSVPVSVGASDGRFVEVSGDQVHEGLDVVTSVGVST